jgi:hypothetical protein
MNETLAAEIDHVQGTLKQQLRHDHRVLKLKLNQFDRLSEVHVEAVLNRNEGRREIKATVNEYFRRQEELQLIDFNKVANTISPKVRAIRGHFADAWMYHIARVSRGYDNQMIAQSFATAFRVLADPLLQRAVSHFAERTFLLRLIAIWKRQKSTLSAIVGCSVLYHRNFGWKHWRGFVRNMSLHRTEGLLEDIRRRREIFTLFPYFDCVDVLPIRPPRPLKEIKAMFKNLPVVSINKKIARERTHHINVRVLVQSRRVMRDFLRAYASYVQEQKAKREILVLMKARNRLKYLRDGYNMFSVNAGKEVLSRIRGGVEAQVYADLTTWFHHFVPYIQRQKRTIAELPQE